MGVRPVRQAWAGMAAYASTRRREKARRSASAPRIAGGGLLLRMAQVLKIAAKALPQAAFSAPAVAVLRAQAGDQLRLAAGCILPRPAAPHRPGSARPQTPSRARCAGSSPPGTGPPAGGRAPARSAAHPPGIPAESTSGKSRKILWSRLREAGQAGDIGHAAKERAHPTSCPGCSCPALLELRRPSCRRQVWAPSPSPKARRRFARSKENMLARSARVSPQRDAPWPAYSSRACPDRRDRAGRATRRSRPSMRASQRTPTQSGPRLKNA